MCYEGEYKKYLCIIRYRRHKRYRVCVYIFFKYKW